MKAAARACADWFAARGPAGRWPEWRWPGGLRAGRPERRPWTVSATGQLLPGAGLLEGAGEVGGGPARWVGAGRDRGPRLAGRAQGGVRGAGQGLRGAVTGQDSLPVLSTFCSSVLALLTVEAKLAPVMSAFIMLGMIWSV